MTSSLQLPDDVLYLLCIELGFREDWATLFNCAVSCKRLAPLALSQLYRFVTSSRHPNACEMCMRLLFWDPNDWGWTY